MRFSHSNRFQADFNSFFAAKGLAPLLHTNVSCRSGNWMQGGTMIAAAIKPQLHGSTENHLDRVLQNELDKLQQRVAETAKGEFFFYLTDSAKELVLVNSTEQHYDARRLKLAIERLIVYPLANLLATDRIQVGDMIRIDRDRNQPGLNFRREVEELAPPLGHLGSRAIPGLFL
jgi:hypothetical protein